MERILVVEDDVQIQNFMIYTLENSGFQVEGALNGKDALSSFFMKGADLILLDLGLPDMDGMDILRKIRNTSEVPIIIVSARTRTKRRPWPWTKVPTTTLQNPFQLQSSWPGLELLSATISV